MIYDVIIIGVGQAGLALGYYLHKSSLKFLILDKENQVGDNWRNRYDSLHLFTPRMFNQLPGFFLEGNQDRYPSKDEIGDYLEHYAKNFKLPIKLNTEVTKISTNDKLFILDTKETTYQAKQVVVATGAFQEPTVPSLSKKLPSSIFQLHSREYKNPSQLPLGDVLVVGSGNSGAQIAVDLAKERNVILSTGHKAYPVPTRIGPKSSFYLLHKTGLLDFIMNQPTSTKLGKYIFENQSRIIIGTEVSSFIRKKKITLRGRLLDFKDNMFHFQYNTTAKAAIVIWATGFTQDFHWIDVPGILDKNSSLIHKRGVTSVPGLYFLGLSGLYSLGSAHLGWVKYDAKYISSQIISAERMGFRV